MGRTAAVLWHASLSLAAGVLYFFFVLPRWPELTGATTHTVGTALRIVTAALIALAALPVVFTLLAARKLERGVPRTALTLRTFSIVGHVVAGVLIAGTAISETWLSLDRAGRWLFGIYGAAAAIAVLAVCGFYLSFVAELPPRPPKPATSTKPRRWLRRRKGELADEATEATEATEITEAAGPAESPEDTRTEAIDEPTGHPETPTVDASEAGDDGPELEIAAVGEPRGGLRNRRPTGKSSSRHRLPRGGIVDDDT
ncbi:hypothetical protein [Mycobacterium sp.]|uniref:hypothetical protein n=1 Tax=Mycobacterium sp. TaxID=1785 RepID=UPI0031CEC14F